MNLIEFRNIPGTPPTQMKLTDPETGEYTVEILDYMGPYSIEDLPGWIARTIINKNATGLVLSKLLIKRVPEFKKCTKVLFYQVNPITN